MNKIKHFLGLIIVVVYSYVNIAALSTSNVSTVENNSLQTCWLGYTTVLADHFACSGILPNCVPAAIDDNLCILLIYKGKPDIVIIPQE